jgi:hypothetical protein
MSTTRRGGQPPLDPSSPSTSVHLRLPSVEYDALYAQASHERVTVPEIIRRKIREPAPPGGATPEDDDDR